MKRLLLVSPVVPTFWNAGAAMLANLCRAMPRGSLACFVVGPRHLQQPVPADLDWMRLEYHPGTRMEAVRPVPGRLGGAAAWAGHTFRWAFKSKALARRAKLLAREVGAEAVVVYLWAEQMFRLADELRCSLDLPMYVVMPDVPDFAYRYFRVDALTRRTLARKVNRVLQASEACAVNTDVWSEQLQRSLGVRTFTIYAGFDGRFACPPARRPNRNGRLVIGYCGAMYPHDTWAMLIRALDSVDWRIGDRDVWLRLLGSRLEMSVHRQARVEYLGWQPDDQLVRCLHDSDVIYCPYWFSREFESEARYMFPSKTAIHLAAGRPVLYHGPPYAAMARFFRENDAAFQCHSAEPTDILDSIESLIADDPRYAELAENARRAFDQHLTTNQMRRRFAEFLGVEPSGLVSEEQIGERVRRVTGLEREIEQRDHGIKRLHVEVRSHDRAIVALHREVAKHDARIAELHGEIARRDQMITTLSSRLIGG